MSKIDIIIEALERIDRGHYPPTSAITAALDAARELKDEAVGSVVHLASFSYANGVYKCTHCTGKFLFESIAQFHDCEDFP